MGMPGLPEIAIILVIGLLLVGVPVGAVIVIVLLTSRSRRGDVGPPSEERVPCPECGERIKPEAVKCRFCGARFDAAPSD